MKKYFVVVDVVKTYRAIVEANNPEGIQDKYTDEDVESSWEEFCGYEMNYKVVKEAEDQDNPEWMHKSLS